MNVLSHAPKLTRKKEHYAIQVNGERVAMCHHNICEGRPTDKSVWIVRRQQPDDNICMGCEQRLEWSKRQPKVQRLPCTETDKSVEIIEREDGKALVHAITTRRDWAFCKAASRHERGWQTRKGVAGELTCERCLKSLGLYEGYVPTRKSAGKVSHHAMQELWDAWYRWNGEYHSSDPRAGE